MKKYISNILKFLILPFVIIFFFEIYLRNMDSVYTEKYDGLMVVKEDINVLFVGNSHANYAVNPLYIKDFTAYNLANISQLLYFDKRLTIKSINEGVANLKYVFISIDYHSLFKSDQGPRNVWSFYSNGIKYEDQDYTKEKISRFFWGYSPKVAISLLKKDLSRRFNGKQSVTFDVENGVNIEDSLYYGFIGYEGTEKKAFNTDNYIEQAKRFQETNDRRGRMEVIQDLKDFISLLKKKNIEPILFSSPTYFEYNKILDKNQIERNTNDLKNLCNEFDLQYWQFDNDSRFIQEDFYDQDHLNKEGAKKFSILINDKLYKYDKLKNARQN